MSDFEVSRIVPSTRDFALAVKTRRKGLALVPILAADEVSSEVGRLDGIEVRALCIDAIGEPSLLAARATESTPLLVVEPVDTTEGCQRARFFGADCVVLTDFAAHRQTVQSMRMMPAALVASVEAAKDAVEAGARVLVAKGELSVVLEIAEATDIRITLVGHVPNADVTALRKLAGQVDAATVPAAVHADVDFEALLDELD